MKTFITAFNVSTFSFTNEKIAPTSKVSLPGNNFFKFSKENDGFLDTVEAFEDDFIGCCEAFCLMKQFYIDHERARIPLRITFK